MSEVIHWNEMTVEEKDVCVAEKVMGRKVYKEDTWGRWLLCREDQPGLTELIPRYTQSLDAAWQVVEHVRKKCFDVHIATALLQYDVLIIERCYGGVCVDAITASAPEAICIAALRATGCKVVD